MANSYAGSNRYAGEPKRGVLGAVFFGLVALEEFPGLDALGISAHNGITLLHGQHKVTLCDSFIAFLKDAAKGTRGRGVICLQFRAGRATVVVMGDWGRWIE